MPLIQATLYCTARYICTYEHMLCVCIVKLESVAKHSVMAARWLGQYRHLSNATDLTSSELWPVAMSELRSYLILFTFFSRLWTKVYQIKFACARVSAVCNAVFQMTMSCCVQEIFAIKSQSCAKSREI